MKNSKLARTTLLLNAAFSILCGVLFIIFPEEISEQLFVNIETWSNELIFWIGVGLVLFSLDVFIVATNAYLQKKQVMRIILADIGWVVVSILVYIFDRHYFTSTGIYLLDGVALIVTLFAISQYIGAKRIKPLQSKIKINIEIVDEKIIASVSQKTQAPTAIVWNIMTDHAKYWEVASNLSKSEIISGQGLGMVRRCYGPKGENWLETCNEYSEGQSYSFDIHTEAADYPYPFSKLKGVWSVKSLTSQTQGANQSEFSIFIEVTPKGGYITKHLFYLASKRKFTGVLVELANAWCKKMELKVG
ncbi:MAG: hypothetical protein KUG78_21110 [Kangiellaceae bacterium]|nr:hypothetical protein [Kangiellaceae bacterium]